MNTNVNKKKGKEFEKDKEEYLYSAILCTMYIYKRSGMHGSHIFICKYTMPAFPLLAFTRWRHH